MTATMNETRQWDAVGAGPEPATDLLLPHLARIVRRALRRPDDLSPLARAVRLAAAQIDPGSFDLARRDSRAPSGPATVGLACTRFPRPRRPGRASRNRGSLIPQLCDSYLQSGLVATRAVIAVRTRPGYCNPASDD